MSATIIAPPRSLEQRNTALRRANAIRSYRAEMKRDLKQRRRHPLALLSAPPSELDTMKVFDLLMAIPKFGRVKAHRTLKQCLISPSKTVAGMSPRQRGELLAMLRASGVR